MLDRLMAVLYWASVLITLSLLSGFLAELVFGNGDTWWANFLFNITPDSVIYNWLLLFSFPMALLIRWVVTGNKSLKP